MARPTINASDCGYTYYKYYFNSISTGKKSSNYLPIIVIELPYSDSELDVTYYGGSFELRPEEMNSFGSSISELLGNHLPCILSMSRHSGIVSSAYPWTSYEDGNFTSQLTLNTYTNSKHETVRFALMDLGLKKPSAGTVLNIGGNAVELAESKNYTDETQGNGLFLCLLRTTSGTLYYNRENTCRYASTFNNANNVITSPSADKFGGITFNPPFTLSALTPTTPWAGDYDVPLKKLIGESTKTDIKDPDPNIDDSDGDKDRTPTSDIGGDTIGDDDLPTLSVMDTGLVTLYNPTVGELSSLGQFLWSDAFSVDTFKKLFSDPFDTLLGLSILPVTPNVSGRHNIYFGNVDSGVACNVVANQFLKVDMGSLTLSETYASAFDYAPSTQVDIYLPFIGSRGLNTNDVMGSTIHLIYKFDLLSGGCIAELFINHTSQGNKSRGLSYNPNMGLAYTFTGQCSCSIPLTSNNYNGMIHSIIQSIGTVGAIGASVATGNPALGLASVATSATTIGLQANTPTVQRSGSIGSSNALLSCLTPYLSVQRAHVCKPGHFYSKRGIPSQVFVNNISSVGSGNYFQIADCADLHANGASDTELAEIKSILTSGAVW